MKKVIFFLFVCFNVSCLSLKTSAVPEDFDENVSEEQKKDNEISFKELPSHEKKVEKVTLNSLLEGRNDFISKDAKIKFCDVINSNKILFENLSLKPIEIPLSLIANKEVSTPFIARLDGVDDSLIKKLEFVVVYPTKTSASLCLNYKKQKIGDDGLISFIPPISNVSIDGEIKIYLNPFKTEKMEEDIDIINEHVEQDLLAKLSVSFPYMVATSNRRISAAIAILDYDQNNKPILKDNKVANKLFVKMMRVGFSRTGLAPFEVLAKRSDKEIIENATTFFDGKVEFYIFGKTYIKKTEKKADSTWQTEIVGTLSIWNLKSGKKLFNFDLNATGSGRSQLDSIIKARTILGEEAMFNKILHNL